MGKHSYGQLAGTTQKVHKITENTECGNMKFGVYYLPVDVAEHSRRLGSS